MFPEYILDKLYSASLLKRESLINSEPVVKTLSLVLVLIACIVFSDPILFIPLLLFPLGCVVLRRDLALFIEALKAPLPIASLIILVTGLFIPWTTSGFMYLIVLFMRIVLMASSILVFIATTNPIHIAYVLEKLRMPKWLVLSTIILWRLIPLVLAISSESCVVTKLKGDKLWRSLIASSAASLLRAVNLMETLYIRGAGLREFSLKPLIQDAEEKATLYYGIVVVAVSASIMIAFLCY